MNLQQLFLAKEEDITGLLIELEHIRVKSELLNCVFRATGSSWLGVNIAGRSMFPDATFEIPQYFSRQVLTNEQINTIARKVASLGFSTFVFHGYVPYFDKFISSLKKFNRDIRILFVFHGFASELSGNTLQINSLKGLVELFKKKGINKIGLVKSGHEILFRDLFGIHVKLLYNKVPILRIPRRPRHGNTQIGVLVNNSFRKNLHVQMMAAMLMENSRIHVLNKNELTYFNSDERIVEHGMLPHNEFIILLGSMDINLHVTYSESFGGQVFTESLGLGVPCLTGYSNGFLDYDPELKSLLSVAEADDPVAISKRIESILPIKDQLSERLIDYCIMMNQKADEILSGFIEEN